jgi:hypothetical protein
LKDRDSARAREAEGERHGRDAPDRSPPNPLKGAAVVAAGLAKSLTMTRTQPEGDNAPCAAGPLSVNDLWRGMVRWVLVRAKLRSDLSNGK